MSRKSQVVRLKLRIWWNSNFGQEAFKHKVESVEEAKKFLTLLIKYDLYLGDKITANTGGLEVFVGVVDYDGWEEWMDDEGRDIFEVLRDE